MLNFETEEQAATRASIQKVAAMEIPRFQTEAHYGTVPRELFKALSAVGIAGLTLPESYDGANAGPLSAMIACEELASVDLGPAVFMSVHAMVGGLIAKFGSPEQKQNFLPNFSAGEKLGAFALTEPTAGSDASALRCEATACPGGFKLRGEKCYITSAGFADVYVVFARTNPSSKRGISAFLVEHNSRGLIIAAPEKKMGCELSPIASITFDNVIVPKELLLGELDAGWDVALSGLDGGRVNIAACANGLSRSALAHAIKHLQERQQFGKKLAEFQALQFMVADMQMKTEAARLLTWQAAVTIEKHPNTASARLYASQAKCFATDTAMAVTTDAVQLLGGAGYLKEYTVERLMREAKMLQIVEGTNQIQRLVISREILKGDDR